MDFGVIRVVGLLIACGNNSAIIISGIMQTCVSGVKF